MAFGQNDIVLVDTNVILEAHRTGCWMPIAEYFALHTVAKVVEETQTGYQNRAQVEWIEEARLRAAFGHIADVTEEQRAAFNIAHQHPSLDAGEKDLLIYAEAMESPAWLLNSPDMAAVRFCTCSRLDRPLGFAGGDDRAPEGQAEGNSAYELYRTMAFGEENRVVVGPLSWCLIRRILCRETGSIGSSVRSRRTRTRAARPA